MLDPYLLRHDIKIVAKKLASKNFLLAVDKVNQQEALRKQLQIKKEHLQFIRKSKSRIVNLAKANGENITILCQEINQINEQLKQTKSELSSLKQLINDYMLLLPNIPADDVPYGSDKKDNIEIKRWGEPRKYNFPIKDHVNLGYITGNIDFTAGVKLAGTRFVVIRGQIARLYRALSQFMLDLHTQQHGYEEYYLPYLVNRTSLYGTGHLPKFYEDLFHIQSINKENISNIYTLIPTAEVPLINLLRDKIFDENILPLKMTANTPCFRAEAGSYGRDTHGLIRMHQFDKVEMVQAIKPEHSMIALEEMTKHAEKVLQLLNLHYRKVLLCTGDTGFASSKTYDLEVWLPSQNIYCEVSSCSNTSDFQTRRVLARYRNKKDKQLRFLHTINGSGLAIGRTLIAILENYQLADGRIEVPKSLRSYMQGLTILG
ncbi:serine--tRNA ligase [Candidatus Palibaumannia cicadellinicola]|uniref:Serine--tRNA ligase n=1 Tax=Baumannia cicadellinicola subsp. Homalodisca coagulata TaxID=374463 RepID=SYS_BAUCH|nr:serine--tRNA ligase [Candidatus Baumannia cicadellinicola]Q1LTE8.1 RecName: Full=Serine--tRNA ligase; AltName: Full=Seryl-tRNA synthetase; Short=SerRS; AltName: Full=Seryl-tRNA(Ser/Sec) synthetase [Baumannia cicadellinicola str. Hc (Homalodisca coagulata)]ABF14125.1 seryl-tRNA synthetase [Baumannia cicadellinicola str. Hc (Homalodisca coagulata)]MBS0032747.1 serine--tRNA ligase [Candidatus Baumannia cicadellinicola]MCJ7462251.1 serine--tRNA ligase [Candidatus Baumannia cicadellinicola]MCJ74